MNTNLKYVGQVDIKLQRGTKLFPLYNSHNSGNVELFNLFAKLMAGQLDIISTSDLPSTVRLFAQKDFEGELKVVECFINPIKVTKYVSKHEQGDYAVMEAIVYSTNLIDVTIYKDYDFYLRLYSENSSLAEIKIDYDVFSKMQSGVQLLITWKLRVEN